METNTTCPLCGNTANRILSEGRYYIYCCWCQSTLVAKAINKKVSALIK